MSAKKLMPFVGGSLNGRKIEVVESLPDDYKNWLPTEVNPAPLDPYRDIVAQKLQYEWYILNVHDGIESYVFKSIVTV